MIENNVQDMCHGNRDGNFKGGGGIPLSWQFAILCIRKTKKISYFLREICSFTPGCSPLTKVIAPLENQSRYGPGRNGQPAESKINP